MLFATPMALFGWVTDLGRKGEAMFYVDTGKTNL